MIKNSLTVGLSCLLTMGGSAFAADYPKKPITIIVPSKADGSTDLTAHLFAKIAAEKHSDFKFVIKNIAGSGGREGFEKIAGAEPDGYTIGMNFTPQMVAHIASGRADYTLDNFHFMGKVAEDPGIIVVPGDSNINNLADLARIAKNSYLTVAVNGVGSDDFIAAKSFEKEAHVIFNLLPTRGSIEQKNGIERGQVDAAFMNLSQMIDLHNAGKVRIIAILDEERDTSARQIPTAKEQGYEVFMTATRGLVTPAGVDKDIKKKLDALFNDVLNDPEFRKISAQNRVVLKPMSGSQYRSYLQKLHSQTRVVYNETPW